MPDRPSGGQERSQRQTSSWFQPSEERYRTQAQYRDPYEERQKNQDGSVDTGASDRPDTPSAPRYPNSGGYPGLGGYQGGAPGMAEPYPPALSGTGLSGDAQAPSLGGDYPFDLPPRDRVPSYRDFAESGTERAASGQDRDLDDDSGPGSAYDLSTRSYRPEDLYPSGTTPSGASHSTFSPGVESTPSTPQGATYRLEDPTPGTTSGYEFGRSPSSPESAPSSGSSTTGTWTVKTEGERGATYRLEDPAPGTTSGYEFGRQPSEPAAAAEPSGKESGPEGATGGWPSAKPDSTLPGYSAGIGNPYTPSASSTDTAPAGQSTEASGGQPHRPPDPTSVYRIPTGDKAQSPLAPNRIVPPYRTQANAPYPGWGGAKSEDSSPLGDGGASAGSYGPSGQGESRSTAESSLGESTWSGLGTGSSSPLDGSGASAGGAESVEREEPRSAADSLLGESTWSGRGAGDSSPLDDSGASGAPGVVEREEPRPTSEPSLGESTWSGLGTGSSSPLGDGGASAGSYGTSDQGESRSAAESSLGGSLGTGSGNTWAFSRDDPRLPDSVREIAERAAQRSSRTDTSSDPLSSSHDPQATAAWDSLKTTDFTSRDSADDRWNGAAEDSTDAEETRHDSPGEKNTSEQSTADPLLAIANEQSRARSKELASQSEADNWDLAEGIVKENTGAVPLPPDLSEEVLEGDRYDELGYDGRSRDADYDDRDYDDYPEDRRYDRDEDYDSGWRGEGDRSYDDRRGGDDEYYDDVDDRYYPEPVRDRGARASRRKDKIAKEFPGFTEPVGGSAADYPGYDNIDVWPETEGLATATLWLGIFALLPGLGLLPAVVALVLGPKAKKNIRDSQGHLEGEQLVKAGTILATIGIVVSVLTVVGYVLLF
ncbi:MAG: hypothetical protein PUE00_04075 [Thermobifida fusca]|nr:hypothetical protein [Thermobifida fusca]